MSRDCLVIVDVQKGFLTPWTDHLPEVVAGLQARFRHVVATRFINPVGSAHRKWIHWNRFGPDTDEVGLAFVPRDGVRVMDKTTYTGLTPDLRADLASNKINEVCLCGIATDGCVLKTAVDLFEARIRPVVLADACASHGGPECHEAGLLLLRRFLGNEQVVTTASHLAFE